LEKPDKITLSRQDLADLQRKLDTMSITSLQDFYRAAHYPCRLDSATIPVGPGDSGIGAGVEGAAQGLNAARLFAVSASYRRFGFNRLAL
jgi:hypothetical protein